MRQLTQAALVTALIATIASPAFADTVWQKHHLRREQVNHRLANQHRRLHQEVKDDDMTHAQAAKLHVEDHQIRQEEQAMAAQNGGHITKQEQSMLNQQENQVSKQIGH